MKSLSIFSSVARHAVTRPTHLHLPRHTVTRYSAVCLILLLGIQIQAANLPAESNAGPLLTSYLRYVLVQQTPKQAETLLGGVPGQVAEQVREQASVWTQQRLAEIRTGLDAYYGPDAKLKFQSFIKKFAAMESENDLDFLRWLNRDMALSPAPANYDELRGLITHQFLGPDVEASAELLGEMQTWVDIQGQHQDAPPLGIWLARDQIAASETSSLGGGQADGDSSDALEDAEGDFEGFTALPDEDMENPLDSFSSARKAKRDRILEESQAGMNLVAEERRAWEAALAEKKQAAAEKDAAAMKRHAETLAAVEEEAFQQRQRSWGNRLKKILASAAGSFAGGVTGGFASRATEEAVNEIWP